jgi:hypothetical protein
MTDNDTPFADYSLEQAIAFRWTLRDIRASRLRLSPVSQDHLTALTDLGLSEMRGDGPALTRAGEEALD